jgi:hypothetical protein
MNKKRSNLKHSDHFLNYENWQKEDDLLERRARLARCISIQGRPHDEIIVECDEADADAAMAEVQAITERRSAQVFNGQKIGVEAHIEDNWGDVKIPTRSTTWHCSHEGHLRQPRKAAESELCGGVPSLGK